MAQPPGPLTGPRAISGRIVRVVDHAPIRGAALELSHGNVRSVVTDEAGRFAMDDLPTTLLSVTLSASEYLTYRSKIDLHADRSDLQFELIPEKSPFDLEFYRELVRGAVDGVLLETRRWTMDPSFHLQSVTVDTGDPVPKEVLDGVERVLVNSVPELTGGRYRVKDVARGTEVSVPEEGWVRVWFYRNPIDGSQNQGYATVGGNGGYIKIRYDPDRDRRVGSILDCEATAVQIADHEIVHVMGFWHTSDRLEDFHSGTGCPGSGRPDRVQYHAAVMYSRPPGNQDIDNDSRWFIHQRANRGEPPLVSCRLDHLRK